MGDWKEYITEFLTNYWSVKGRPDLFNDVVDHVLNVYPEKTFDYTGHYPDDSQDKAEEELVILGEAFAFLQTHCTSAVSSQDLEFMALTEKERLLHT